LRIRGGNLTLQPCSPQTFAKRLKPAPTRRGGRLRGPLEGKRGPPEFRRAFRRTGAHPGFAAGGSQMAGELLTAHPEWLAAASGTRPAPASPPRAGLPPRIERWSNPPWSGSEIQPAFDKLREFKQREMLRSRRARSGPAGRDAGNYARNLRGRRCVSGRGLSACACKPLSAASGPAVPCRAGRPLGGDAVLRAGPGQTGRAGIELQFRRGRYFSFTARRGVFSKRAASRRTNRQEHGEPFCSSRVWPRA